jgi:hypothetical protein
MRREIPMEGLLRPADPVASRFTTTGFAVERAVISRELLDVAFRYYLSYVPVEGYYGVHPDVNALDRYADALSEAMFPAVQDRVERATGVALLPTYSYARIYTTQSHLRKHVDRGACEVSATVNIGCRNVDESWPIYVEAEGRDLEIDLARGDALIYRGMDLPHWRRPLDRGIWCQVFFHFVERDGALASEHYDRRGGLGPRHGAPGGR